MKHIKVRPFAVFIFGLFAIVFIALALATGTKIADVKSAIGLAYKTVPILILVWTGFITVGWRWKVFKEWLVPFPDLDGTWQGLIQTTWKDANGNTQEPIPVILTIKQSFGRVSCVMRTKEMTSHSYLADFWLDTDEQVRKLGYSYTSTPRISLHHRSPPHEGCIVLEIVGDPAFKLKGVYWTNRKTTGEVTLVKRCKNRLDEFPDDLGTHPMQDK